MHLKYYFNTFILFCLCSNPSPSLGYCVYFSKGTHGRHVSHVCWDLQAAALQEVTAKVQRKPTQEHHSNGNCAVEAGMAELPRQLWGGTMAGCRQLCRQLGTGNGMGERRQGRWWLFSSPRLAGPIADRLNMTELTLLSYSEGKRKINGGKRLQHWLHEMKRVCSFLAAPNAIGVAGLFT